MIDLELFNKLRKESGDEWYVFIGTSSVPACSSLFLLAYLFMAFGCLNMFDSLATDGCLCLNGSLGKFGCLD